MNIERNFEATLWRHRWRHHHKKIFWHNFGRYFHIWGQNEAVFHISKFSKWPPFEPATNFLPEIIPDVEYTRKIAMSISDILSFWSTLWFKYWRRYINFKIWPILWPGDVINDVMNMYSYNCSHNLMIYNENPCAWLLWHWSSRGQLALCNPRGR